jgi:hypothetical protein
MILINRCFSETTPESAAECENSDSGFIAEDVAYGFRELVELLKSHPEASCSPATGETFEWYSTGHYTECYRTATEREESVHYSRNNPARNAKYWRWAAIAAGIVRG